MYFVLWSLKCYILLVVWMRCDMGSIISWESLEIGIILMCVRVMILFVSFKFLILFISFIEVLFFCF